MALSMYASSFNKYFLQTNYGGGILCSTSNSNTAGIEGKNVDFWVILDSISGSATWTFESLGKNAEKMF